MKGKMMAHKIRIQSSFFTGIALFMLLLAHPKQRSYFPPAKIKAFRLNVNLVKG